MPRPLLLLLALAPLLVVLPAGPAAHALQDDRVALPDPPTPKVVARRGHVGRVSDVTHNTITVQCLDIMIGGEKLSNVWSGRRWSLWTGESLTLYKWRGLTQCTDPVAVGRALLMTREGYFLIGFDGNVSAFRLDAMAPTMLRASRTLASGGFATDKGESRSYRLEDVQIGDSVDIEAESIGGEWRAVAITITGRPGGRIPPSQLAGKTKNPYHIGANQRQDWLEKGIPIPKDPHLEEIRRQLRSRKTPPPVPDSIPNSKD